MYAADSTDRQQPTGKIIHVNVTGAGVVGGHRGNLGLQRVPAAANPLCRLHDQRIGDDIHHVGCGDVHDPTVYSRHRNRPARLSRLHGRTDGDVAVRVQRLERDLIRGTCRVVDRDGPVRQRDPRGGVRIHDAIQFCQSGPRRLRQAGRLNPSRFGDVVCVGDHDVAQPGCAAAGTGEEYVTSGPRID